MEQNSDLKAFRESLSGEEKKAFFSFMEEKTSSGVDEADACIQYAELKGYHVTADELYNVEGVLALSGDEMEQASGGTCFTAGTPDQVRMWNCPASCKNSYRTGNEREEPHFIFWSRHVKEYYCPDCDSVWWKYED